LGLGLSEGLGFTRVTIDLPLRTPKLYRLLVLCTDCGGKTD
jgi:hypothetical protein